jgi:peptidoglycan/xylan/chitin deacetylase (PgdA/CDA1 family)
MLKPIFFLPLPEIQKGVYEQKLSGLSMRYLLIFLIVFLLLFLYARKQKALKNGVRIFMYHHIGLPEDSEKGDFFVTAELFSQQLDWLNKYCSPLSLAQLEDCFLNKKPLPANAVLLTFDDGYLDNYEYAYPLAMEKNIPLTIFLTTGETGCKKNMLTWEQVKEMGESQLITFASHGVSHRRLRQLDDETVRSELANSKAVLEEKLQKPQKSFCYPYGAFDKRVRRLVFEAGYVLDFGTRKGINAWPWSGRKPLLRAHVMRGETLHDFQRQLKTGFKRKII